MINFNYPLIGGKLIERKIRQWEAEGYAIGLAKGRAQENAKWSAWNKRRIAAKKDGAPFDEPSPDGSRPSDARGRAVTACKSRRGTPTSPAR